MEWFVITARLFFRKDLGPKENPSAAYSGHQNCFLGFVPLQLASEPGCCPLCPLTTNTASRRALVLVFSVHLARGARPKLTSARARGLSLHGGRTV